MRKWNMIPKVRYTNYHKAYPICKGTKTFGKWFRVGRYWGGRIVNVSVKHHSLSFDFRHNWVADMIDFRTKV